MSKQAISNEDLIHYTRSWRFLAIIFATLFVGVMYYNHSLKVANEELQMQVAELQVSLAVSQQANRTLIDKSQELVAGVSSWWSEAFNSKAEDIKPSADAFLAFQELKSKAGEAARETKDWVVERVEVFTEKPEKPEPTMWEKTKTWFNGNLGD